MSPAKLAKWMGCISPNTFGRVDSAYALATRGPSQNTDLLPFYSLLLPSIRFAQENQIYCQSMSIDRGMVRRV